jgi:hypothetical protein
MTHAVAHHQQSTKPAANAQPARRTSAQAKRRSAKQDLLSFMRTTHSATTYWSTPDSVPSCYPEIHDANVRTWHEAFFAGRQRSAEYIRHVKQHGGRAVSLNWIVGDMPAEALASLSLSMPRRGKEGSAIDRGLVAGFFHGLMEMATRQVNYGDIEWDALVMDAKARGVLIESRDAA